MKNILFAMIAMILSGSSVSLAMREPTLRSLDTSSLLVVNLPVPGCTLSKIIKNTNGLRKISYLVTDGSGCVDQVHKLIKGKESSVYLAREDESRGSYKLDQEARRQKFEMLEIMFNRLDSEQKLKSILEKFGAKKSIRVTC